MISTIDLNCDIGEHTVGGYDSELLPHITSANICCGTHAGSQHITEETIALTAIAGVAIGAHPGMPGEFGRSDGPIDPDDAFRQVKSQLSRFMEAAAKLNATVRHVKPHGALYNQAEQNESLAEAIASAIQEVNPTLTVYALAGGQLLQIASSRGLKTAGEFFADRQYAPSGKLLPRTDPAALISSVDIASLRAVTAYQEGRVVAADGTPIKVDFATICIHGDSPFAVPLARNLLTWMTVAGIVVCPFVAIER
jgi:5-oxoprolinase (ATP-hydrolysing) subunit A